MQLFYLPNITGIGTYAQLDAEEARHCLKVLRKRVGDKIEAVDGAGNIYEAELITDDLRDCTVQITRELEDSQRRAYKITIAIAPSKNNERLEWFLEKATEIGIDRVIPIFTDRSERRKLNTERLKKIMVSAMKQSGKALLPQLDEATDLNKVLLSPDHEGYNKYIATCFGDNRPHLKDIYTKGSNVLILIGPEGDFTEKEADVAIKNGFKPISLGRSRLRLETAGMVACHIINLANE